jgi:two-component system nitrogen regulation response regulator GlnG
LGIARTALYERLQRTPGLRWGADLSPVELREAHARCAGDIERMVDELQVSRDALLRRLKDLGLR